MTRKTFFLRLIAPLLALFFPAEKIKAWTYPDVFYRKKALDRLRGSFIFNSSTNVVVLSGPSGRGGPYKYRMLDSQNSILSNPKFKRLLNSFKFRAPEPRCPGSKRTVSFFRYNDVPK